MAVTGKKTFKMTAAADVLTGTYYITRIQWIAASSTDNDSLVLTNIDGDIIMESVADAATYTDTLYVEQWVTNLTATTMASGYIIVTTR
jgi:hypothetical protein